MIQRYTACRIHKENMSSANRTRLIAASIIALVIPIGLLARTHRSAASLETLNGFLATYTGDTLWPILFYFLGRLAFTRASSIRLFLTALAITLTLEFGQLWKPAILQWLRQQPISGFILGNHFIWSDVACCIVGSVLALIADLTIVTDCSRAADA